MFLTETDIDRWLAGGHLYCSGTKAPRQAPRRRPGVLFVPARTAPSRTHITGRIEALRLEEATAK